MEDLGCGVDVNTFKILFVRLNVFSFPNKIMEFSS